MANKEESTSSASTSSEQQTTKSVEKKHEEPKKKPVYLTAEEVDEKLKGMKTLNIVLLVSVAVIFLWVGWISARIHLHEQGGYYDSSNMMRDMYPRGNNWNYR